MQITFPVFHEVLQYELYASERYRRYVSLVLLHSSADHQELNSAVYQLIRKSDIIASYDHVIAVLMSETDQNGALCAVDRFHAVLRHQFHVCFAVATYPSDGASVEGLLAAAEKRLQKAQQNHNGHVIYQD